MVWRLFSYWSQQLTRHEALEISMSFIVSGFQQQFSVWSLYKEIRDEALEIPLNLIVSLFNNIFQSVLSTRKLG